MLNPYSAIIGIGFFIISEMCLGLQPDEQTGDDVFEYYWDQHDILPFEYEPIPLNDEPKIFNNSVNEEISKDIGNKKRPRDTQTHFIDQPPQKKKKREDLKSQLQQQEELQRVQNLKEVMTGVTQLSYYLQWKDPKGRENWFRRRRLSIPYKRSLYILSLLPAYNERKDMLDTMSLQVDNEYAKIRAKIIETKKKRPKSANIEALSQLITERCSLKQLKLFLKNVEKCNDNWGERNRFGELFQNLKPVIIRKSDAVSVANYIIPAIESLN